MAWGGGGAAKQRLLPSNKVKVCAPPIVIPTNCRAVKHLIMGEADFTMPRLLVVEDDREREGRQDTTAWKGEIPSLPRLRREMPRPALRTVTRLRPQLVGQLLESYRPLRFCT